MSQASAIFILPAVDTPTVFFPPYRQQRAERTFKNSATAERGITSMSSNEGVIYDPEELSLLGKVLDQVMQSLPPNLRTPYNRAEIAKNILACAHAGERDPDVLVRAALTDQADTMAA
jgi:hypothetical protein